MPKIKINWKLRFHNKAFVLSFCALVVTFIYNLLGLFGVVPGITASQVTDLLVLVVQLLAALGIVTDPTTEGIQDSGRVLGCESGDE